MPAVVLKKKKDGSNALEIQGIDEDFRKVSYKPVTNHDAKPKRKL
jgi:hypothetical protein